MQPWPGHHVAERCESKTNRQTDRPLLNLSEVLCKKGETEERNEIRKVRAGSFSASRKSQRYRPKASVSSAWTPEAPIPGQPVPKQMSRHPRACVNFLGLPSLPSPTKFPFSEHSVSSLGWSRWNSSHPLGQGHLITRTLSRALCQGV